MNIITDAMGAQITAAITADAIGLDAMSPTYDKLAGATYHKQVGLDIGAPAPTTF